jgi:hypothetical protein
MDFTIHVYKKLLEKLISNDYHFITVRQYAEKKNQVLPERYVILRHDVDKLPVNSLIFARIQAESGIKGTYYFRAIEKRSWVPEIVTEIHSLGHEIGYHYENLSYCRGDSVKAIDDFGNNLAKMRKLVPVDTICMHGSPLSRFDNRDIWKQYNYQDYGIICEPYFDVNFNQVFYLTDTGRRWDGEKVSVRDKISSQNRFFHSTHEMNAALDKNTFPERVMFTFHPQRWNDNRLLWLKEYFFQNSKNRIKFLLTK